MAYKPIATVTERIRKAMEITGMRQIELAEKTGISKGLISLYLSGKVKDVKTDKIAILARALNVNDVWLMGMDVPMERPIVRQTVTPTEQSIMPNPETDTNTIRNAIPSKPVSEYEINNDFVEVMDAYSKLDDNKKKLFMSYLRWLTNN